jgi:iron uptake system component EfeO
MKKEKLAFAFTAAVAATACSSSNTPKTDAEYRQDVTTGMHDSLLGQIQALHAASVKLQAAAPTTTGRGWDATMDATAIQAMKDAWTDARHAYEAIEGATAPLFPNVDLVIDSRYDDFLMDLGPAGDQNLFDDQGVIGMHAIERILYQPETPASVIQFESTLPGYKAAAWPASEDEANQFKNKLCARLVSDTEDFLSQWTPQKIDVPGALDGLISLMNEQREKVVKAASSEEESRYSQTTMADIRDNLAGTKSVYALFEPWVDSKSGGSDADAAVENGFASLNTTYQMYPGDSIPQPPADWSAESPTAANLATDFGKLYTAVFQAVDPNRSGSVVDSMNEVAAKLGLTQFTEGQ